MSWWNKKLIWDLIKVAMKFSSLNSVLGLKRDKIAEAKFIDDSFIYWKEKFSPALTKILEKVYQGWKKE